MKFSLFAMTLMVVIVLVTRSTPTAAVVQAPQPFPPGANMPPQGNAMFPGQQQQFTPQGSMGMGGPLNDPRFGPQAMQNGMGPQQFGPQPFGTQTPPAQVTLSKNKKKKLNKLETQAKSLAHKLASIEKKIEKIQPGYRQLNPLPGLEMNNQMPQPSLPGQFPSTQGGQFPSPFQGQFQSQQGGPFPGQGFRPQQGQQFGQPGQPFGQPGQPFGQAGMPQQGPAVMQRFK